MPAHDEVKSLLNVGRTDIPAVEADARFLLGPLVAGVVALGRGAGDLAEQPQEISLAAAHLENSAARGRKVSGQSLGQPRQMMGEGVGEALAVFVGVVVRDDRWIEGGIEHQMAAGALDQ